MGQPFSIMSVPVIRIERFFSRIFEDYAMNRLAYGTIRTALCCGPDLDAHSPPGDDQLQFMHRERLTQVAVIEAIPRRSKLGGPQMRASPAPPRCCFSGRRIEQAQGPFCSSCRGPRARSLVYVFPNTQNGMEVEAAGGMPCWHSRCPRASLVGTGIRRVREDICVQCPNSLENLQLALERVDHWDQENL